MTRLWSDGFDTYSVTNDLLSNYTFWHGGTAFGSTSGRYGLGAVVQTGGISGLVKILDTGVPELWISGAIYIFGPNENAFSPVIQLGSGISEGNIEASICVDTNALAFGICTGNYSQFSNTRNYAAGSIANIVTLNAWHWINVHAISSPTHGLIEIYLDDTLVLSASNLNTDNYGLHYFNTVTLGMIDAGIITGSVNFAFDDLIINDTTGASPWNSRIPDSRISDLVPVSDVGPNTGTPSSGTSHYSLINQLVGYTPTNYITLTSVSGQEEAFGVQPLPVIPGEIYGVEVISEQLKTNSGAAQGNIGVISSGVESVGSNFTLMTSYSQQRAFFPIDPNTTLPWTNAGISNLIIRYKVP